MAGPYTRDQVIAISNRIADEVGIPRLLLLACGIAESNLRWDARRPTTAAQDQQFWPDVSPGVWQQAVRWSKEYLDWVKNDMPSHPPAAFPGADVVAAVMEHYWDVEHAGRVAAQQLKGKYNPAEANAIEKALARYNWPAGGGAFASDAHAANYRRGIREAEAILGAGGPGPVNEPGTGQVYHFPVQGYTGKISLHWDVPGAVGGTDIFAAKGTPVVAIADGTVVYRVAGSPMGGNAVQIEHDTDGMQSYYAHGDRAPLVQMGQHVDGGTMLFGVGDTGNAAGKGHHLHFGMGVDIQTGSGVQSGTGTDFDAVALLRSLLAAPPKPGVPDPSPPSDDLAKAHAEIARLNAELAAANSKLGVGSVDYADALAEQIRQLQSIERALRALNPAA